MDDEIRLKVTLPTDDEGMVGRECPQCKQYFKIKPGTGLAEIGLALIKVCLEPRLCHRMWKLKSFSL